MCILENKISSHREQLVLSTALETLDIIDGSNKGGGCSYIADKLEIAFEHVDKIGDIDISTDGSQDDESNSDCNGDSNSIEIYDEDEDEDAGY
jgi:hypothetical protein